MDDQIYYISFPFASYEPADFTVQSICPQELEYDMKVVSDSTGQVIQSGEGKLVGWETSSRAAIGTYTVTITATNRCKSTSGTYKLIIKDKCEVATLTLDPDDLIFRIPAIDYGVGQSAQSISWSRDIVVEQFPFDCGQFLWRVTN